MPKLRPLNDRFDLVVRDAERLHGYWEGCGDIVDRDAKRTVGRVYGHGRSGASAEQEVVREAERWLLRESRQRSRMGAMHSQ